MRELSWYLLEFKNFFISLSFSPLGLLKDFYNTCFRFFILGTDICVINLVVLQCTCDTVAHINTIYTSNLD